jgi:hypothetical protein
MITVADVQNEVPSLISRWGLGDAVGSAMVVDDIGGINLLTIGTPVLSLPSMIKGDAVGTSVLGSVGNYFSALVAPYVFSGGLTLEGLSTADPNGNSFSLISIPGQAQLQFNGLNLAFNVWIGTTLHTLTATNSLLGWPQHVIGTYDPLTATQALYVDGQLVIQAVIGGNVGTSVAINTTGTTSTVSKTITAIPTTTGMQLGGVVTAFGVVPSNSFITAIPSSTSITINAFPLANGSGEAITVGMPVTIAFPTTVAATLAAAQDVAIYGAPLSTVRIKQHFQAFRQILSDPGHVRVYPQIGVYS